MLPLDLGRYYKLQKKYPRLSLIDFLVLLNKYHNGCKESGNKIIYSYTYLAMQRALYWKKKTSLRMNIPFDDLIQVAFMGIIVALKKYDKTKNCKFYTVALRAIETHIIDFLRSEHLIHIPANVIRHINISLCKTEKHKKEWESYTPEMQSNILYAKKLIWKSSGDIDKYYLDSIYNYNPKERIESQADEESIRAKLQKCLDKLTKNEKTIIIYEYELFGLNKLAATELSEILNCSIGYVYELKKKAFQKFKKYVISEFKILEDKNA